MPFAFGRQLWEDLRIVLRAGLNTVPGSLLRVFAILLVPVDACNIFCNRRRRACQDEIAVLANDTPSCVYYAW